MNLWVDDWWFLPLWWLGGFNCSVVCVYGFDFLMGFEVNFGL